MGLGLDTGTSVSDLSDIRAVEARDEAKPIYEDEAKPTEDLGRVLEYGVVPRLPTVLRALLHCSIVLYCGTYLVPRPSPVCERHLQET